MYNCLEVEILFSNCIVGQTGAGKSSKEPKARDGVKRKSAGESDQHAKIVKTESDMIMRKCDSGEATLETKLEAQARALWDLKDNLKKHVSNVELRQMLEANDQSTSGSELVLRDRW